MLTFDYSCVSQVDVTVAVGGGPTASSSNNKIFDFIKDKTYKIFGANYVVAPEIKPDYIYFGDAGRFKALVNNAILNNCDVIVSSTMVRKFSPEFWRKTSEKIRIYRIFTPKSRETTIRLTEDGRFPFPKIIPSGFATIAISLLSRPKKILIVGVDGPSLFKRGKVWKRNFRGKLKRYGNMRKYRNRKRILEQKILPFLLKQGVEIYCPKESPLWNINKSKFNIKSC